MAEKEVYEAKKRLRERIYDKTKKSALKFKREFKKQVIVGVTAAFAFLIALSWREPISDFVNNLIENLGLKENLIYFKFLSAIIVTVIAVLILIFISRWASKEE